MNVGKLVGEIMDYIDRKGGGELTTESWIALLEQVQAACHLRIEVAKCECEETD